MTIKRELGELEGVASVTADAGTKQVTVEWDAPATWDGIKALLTEINYPPMAVKRDMTEPTRLTLPITGMTCANCASTVERSLKKAEGVSDAVVNFATEQATVSFDPTSAQACRPGAAGGGCRLRRRDGQGRIADHRNDLRQLCRHRRADAEPQGGRRRPGQRQLCHRAGHRRVHPRRGLRRGDGPRH